MHDLRRAKLIVVRMVCMTADLVFPVLSEIMVASFLRTVSHSFPHPPETEKMRGVKVDFSISLIRAPYFFFFSLSFYLKRVEMDFLA